MNLVSFEHYRDNYQELLTNKEDYTIFVRALTERNYDLFKNMINPNLSVRHMKVNHVDHIFSISEGFKQKIDPFLIAHPCNLQILAAKKNMKKGASCGHTIEALKEKVELKGIV
jgi:hypothetical protein